MKLKNILFDLDGTLTNPQEGIFNSIIYSLKQMGIEEVKSDKLLPFIGPPLIDSYQKIFNMTPEQAQEAVNQYRVYFPEKGMFENEVYEGIPELLTNLNANGFKLFLATSKPLVYAKQILKHFHLYDFFDGFGGAELDGRRNYKNEVIQYLIDTYSINPNESIMVGDKNYDVLGAKEHGIKTIGVTYGFGTEAELNEAGAWVIVKSVFELGETINTTINT